VYGNRCTLGVPIAVHVNGDRQVSDSTLEFHELRKSKGLSLQQLANLTGYSKSHVANVESGTASPSKKYVESFQRAVGLLDTPLEDPMSLRKITDDITLKVAHANEVHHQISMLVPNLKELQKLHTDLIQQVNIITRNRKYPATVSSEIVMAPSMEQTVSTIVAALLQFGLTKDEPDTFNEIVSDVWDRIPTPDSTKELD
jgi:transcriptional regulator with XRE-family HTH domain